jgi:hypothetical protein
MEPWSFDLRGRFQEHTITSEQLRRNPLGDPFERPLWVYTPPGYDDEPDRGYASVYVIQGLTGQLDMWRNRTPFRKNFPELADELFSGGEVPPASPDGEPEDATVAEPSRIEQDDRDGVRLGDARRRGQPGTEYNLRVVDFFRTEQGKTLRMEESDEGAPRVDILKQGIWTSAPRGMFGLRLSKGSVASRPPRF